LATFDIKLRAMADSGSFDEGMGENLDRLLRETKPAMLTEKELSQFYQTARKASIERIIMEARVGIPISSLPLGRFLQLIRDRCRLSRVQIAESLNKDTTFVERVEEGQINPLTLMANEVADIMQLFRLTLTEIATTIKSFLSLTAVKRCKISGMARSSIKSDATNKGETLAHAMDAALQEIAKKKTQGRPDAIKIDPDYIEAVKQELKRRRAEDLLI
jgi:hypothetical protein